jgi:hypothetical protein
VAPRLSPYRHSIATLSKVIFIILGLGELFLNCLTECRYASAIMLIVIKLGLSSVFGGMLIGSMLSINMPNFVIMPSITVLSVIIQ